MLLKQAELTFGENKRIGDKRKNKMDRRASKYLSYLPLARGCKYENRLWNFISSHATICVIVVALFCFCKGIVSSFQSLGGHFDMQGEIEMIK